MDKGDDFVIEYRVIRKAISERTGSRLIYGISAKEVFLRKRERLYFIPDTLLFEEQACVLVAYLNRLQIPPTFLIKQIDRNPAVLREVLVALRSIQITE